MKKLDEGNHFNRHANLLFTFFLQPEYLTTEFTSSTEREMCKNEVLCATATIKCLEKY